MAMLNNQRVTINGIVWDISYFFFNNTIYYEWDIDH